MEHLSWVFVPLLLPKGILLFGTPLAITQAANKTAAKSTSVKKSPWQRQVEGHRGSKGSIPIGTFGTCFDAGKGLFR